MSLSGTHLNGDFRLIRELVNTLQAWDAGAGSGVLLQAGSLVFVRRIRREPFPGSATGPYLTEFECQGRLYACPLYEFQARTRLADLESAQAIRDEETRTVQR